MFSRRKLFYQIIYQLTWGHLIGRWKEIQILFLYATEDGKQSIQKYLANHDFLKNAKIKYLQNIDVSPVDERFCSNIKEIYEFSDERDIPKPGFYPIIREFNQPKRNIFPSELLNPDNIASLFVKKPELWNSVGKTDFVKVYL